MTFLIRNPVDFWNLQISHKAIVPGLNLLYFFFLGSSGVFWSSLLPLFFFSLLCFDLFLSPLSSTLHYLPIFIYLLYLLLLMYSITLPCCCSFFSFSDNYNFKIKSSKRCSIRKFCMTLHLHEELMSSKHVIPLFDFVSFIPFLKPSWCATTSCELLWIL